MLHEVAPRTPRRSADYTNTPIDDLPVVLNPAIQNDLRVVLSYTQPERRWKVMLAFLGFDQQDVAQASGITERSLSGWFAQRGPTRAKYHTRLPLGAAFRIAKVLGQEVDLLFAAYF